MTGAVAGCAAAAGDGDAPGLATGEGLAPAAGLAAGLAPAAGLGASVGLAAPPAGGVAGTGGVAGAEHAASRAPVAPRTALSIDRRVITSGCGRMAVSLQHPSLGCARSSRDDAVVHSGCCAPTVLRRSSRSGSVIRHAGARSPLRGGSNLAHGEHPVTNQT